MNLLLTTTGFLAGAAMIALPLILHFINRRPTVSLDFPAFDFLKPSKLRPTRRYSLKQWLVLLLRMLAIITLAYAFCRPYQSTISSTPGTATVLLWDDSFSMNAAPHASELRQAAIDLINKCDGDNPMQIGFIRGRYISWSGNFTGDRNMLRQCFEQESCNQYGSAFDQIITQADFRLRTVNTPHKKIVLITDRQQLPWERVRSGEQLSSGVTLEVIWPSEHQLTNAAITKVELPGVNKTGNEAKWLVKTTLKNFGKTPLAGKLRVRFTGEPEVVRNVKLKPGETRKELFELAAKDECSQGTAVLEINDDLEADNIRYFTCNAQNFDNTRIFSPDKNPVDFTALALNVKPESGSEERLDFPDCPENKLFVLQSSDLLSVANQERLKLFVRNGGSLAVTMEKSPQLADFLELFDVKTERARPENVISRRFGNIDFDHPAMQLLAESGLSGWYEILFFRTFNARLPNSAQIIAEFNNGTPAIAEIPCGSGRIILFMMNFARSSTNWPGHYTFLPFWRELHKYCGRAANREKDFLTDTPLTGQPGEELLKIVNGVPSLYNTAGGACVYPTAGNYFWRESGGKPIRPFSINLPEEESNYQPTNIDWRKLTITAPPEKDETNPETDNREKTEFYRYFIWLCLAFFLVEALLANRTNL